MILVYALIGAAVLSVLLMGYGRLVGSRNSDSRVSKRRTYPDMWLESLLDCEYSPTKQSYGPARILPVTKVKLMPTSRGCENC
ncbi:MAG: hypothetical protein JW779_01690 [Candidatus Thorarchaeota archaeon]|nr:hypothetical protein [Candidatus Thorarchaeota archaeon]